MGKTNGGIYIYKEFILRDREKRRSAGQKRRKSATFCLYNADGWI